MCAADSLLNIRKPENTDAFKAFVCVILPAVVRKLHFRNNRCHKLISDEDFVSIPDEAFGLLILENNYTKWEMYVTNGRKCNDAKKIPTKFAPSARSTNWASNPKALTRYNEYYRMIQLERGDEKQQDIERDIMDAFQDEYGNKIRRSGKRRFGELDESNNGNEEAMPELPIAAIDSFA